MCNCSSCCQLCQTLESSNQSDSMGLQANVVELILQKGTYSNVDKAYVNNNDPDTGNHVIGNCSTNLSEHKFCGNNQCMYIQQSTSLYPGNLANSNQCNFAASPSLTEQFESVRPHLNPTNWGKVDDNPITMGTEVNMCTVSFINRYCFDTGNGHYSHLVFISNEQNIRKFYVWEYNNPDQIARLSECSEIQVGYIEILYSICIPIKFLGEAGVGLDPKLAFEQYQKDMWCYETYGHSYTVYVETLIDEMIDQCDHVIPQVTDLTAGVITKRGSNPHCRPCPCNIFTPSPEQLPFPDAVTHDFNDQDKTRGFLAHESLKFTFIGPDRQTPTSSNLQSYINMAKTIGATGLPNYQMARLPVHSNLNIDAWRHHLQGYHNEYLIQYLTFGFPLSLSKDRSPNNPNIANHHSALHFEAAVSDYIDKEITLGAILGPFDEIEYSSFHCSPLLTRPKDGNKRRVILNLSYPTGASLNDAVTRDLFDDKSFTLRFPTIDDIVDKIRSTKGTALLSKIDVARAFRNLRVDPVDAFKFGIQRKGKYYLDVAVAFGWIHGSVSFQMASDAILYMMRKENCAIFAYIDDFIMVASQEDAMGHFAKLSQLFKELGLPMNPDKVSPPTRTLTCLGITIDLDNNSLSIEKSKVEEIYAECLQVKSKTSLTRRKFQSLLGKLIYLHKCIKPARIFINRILSLFRESPNSRNIKLTNEFFMDIDWFLTFIPHFSGSARIFKPDIQKATSLHIDACLTGVGGMWNDRVYAAPVPTFINLQPNITHLEMLNILIALWLWARFWASSSVVFHCDNLAVVQVVASGKTKDSFLSACIRNIWLLTAIFDIDLHIEHIQGVKNTIADHLSRVYSKKGVPPEALDTLHRNYTWEVVPIQFFNLDLHI